MFKDFFKPAWQSSSVDKRRAAVDTLNLDKPEERDALVGLALRDDDAKVRKLADARLNDLTVLASLLAKPISENYATKKLLEKLRLIDNGSALLAEHPQLKPLMLTHVGDAALRQKLQAELNTDEELLAVMLATPWKDSKRALAARLSSLESVDKARKELKGKDKQAERALKLVHDQLLGAKRHHEEFEARRDQTLSDLQNLSTSVWSPDYKLRFLSLTQSWNTLLDDELAAQLLAEPYPSQWRSAIVKAQATLDAGQAIHDAEITLVTSAERAEQLLAQVQNLDEATSLEQSAKVADIQGLNNAWEQAAGKTSAEPQVNQRFKTAIAPLLAWAGLVEALAVSEPLTPSETLAKLDDLLSKYAAKLSLVDDVRQRRDLLQQQSSAEIKKANKEKTEKVDALHKQVGSLFGAIRRGDLRKARSIHSRLSSKLDGLDAKDRGGLEKRLGDATEKMQEMGDWAEFATTPKYEELCVQMEAIPSIEIAPRERADQIKALQDEWKALGVAPADDVLWERFRTAADIAWKPCAEYFDQRRTQREKNLEKREEISEAMGALAAENGADVLLSEASQADTPSSDEQPALDEAPATEVTEDSSEEGAGAPEVESVSAPTATPSLSNEQAKALQSQFHSLSAKWENFRDVDRKALKPVAEKFEFAKAAVQRLLDQIYDYNKAQKQALIDRTVALGSADASAHQMHQVKQLQAAWKQIGITRREEGDELWAAFRAACDLSYGKDREQREQAKGAEKEAENALRQFAADIRSLSAQDEIKFNELVQGFQKARAEATEFHEKALERIDKDFAKATDVFERAQDSAKADKALAQMENLRGLAALCEKLEAGAEASVIEGEWAELAVEDKALMQKISQRLASAQGSASDVEQAEQQRRMLCIKLEILAGIETPEADKSLRMQYQLDQLANAGIGAQIETGAKELETEWLCAPGASASVQASLNERFANALYALTKKAA